MGQIQKAVFPRHARTIIIFFAHRPRPDRRETRCTRIHLWASLTSHKSIVTHNRTIVYRFYTRNQRNRFDSRPLYTAHAARLNLSALSALSQTSLMLTRTIVAALLLSVGLAQFAPIPQHEDFRCGEEIGFFCGGLPRYKPLFSSPNDCPTSTARSSVCVHVLTLVTDGIAPRVRLCVQR
jgi:hypothetical protein